MVIEKLKKEPLFFALSDWGPKIDSSVLKEKIIWPFKDDRQKITIFLLIGILVVMAGFFNFLLDQKKVLAQINISSWEDLYNIRNNLSGNYILVANLSSSTPGYDDYAGAFANNKQGWIPIGNRTNPFKGNFDGGKHKIKDLLIKSPEFDYVGLFGYIDAGASINGIGIERADITGKDYVGGLVGYSNNGTISRVYIEGNIKGERYIGGIAGASYLKTSVKNSFSTANISGSRSMVGGLIGYNEGTIDYSYFAGTVNGPLSTGGLIGVNNCFLGYTPCDNISNSFYDRDLSGQNDTDKGEPKITSQMKDVRTFTNVSWSSGLSSPWDFLGNPYDDINNDDFWDIKPEINNGYPFLTFFVSSEEISPIKRYNISLYPFPDKGGEVFGTGSYIEDSLVSANASFKEGYRFLFWKDGENIVSTEPIYTFIANSDRILTAHFEKKRYLITNLSREFTVFSIEMDEDLTKVPQEGEVLAIFKKGETPISKINISFKKDLNWSGIKADTGYYSLNDINYGRAFVHFESKEKEGILSLILLIPAIKNSGEVYLCPFAQKMEDINKECQGLYYLKTDPLNGFYEVEVTNTGGAENLKATRYNLFLSTSPQEGGTVNGFGEYFENESVTIEAFPREEYQFLNWTEDEIVVSEEEIYTFLLKSDRKLEAKFIAVSDLVFGCTDSLALNYNPLANKRDNSCEYKEEISSDIFAKEVKKSMERTKDFIESSLGKVAINTIALIGSAIGTANLIASAIFIKPFSFSNIFFTLLRLWSILLASLGLKKRHRPWGTVYDSITKQPLDPAYLFLQDKKGKVVSDSITDLDGRYGFLVKPGVYKIVANKTNYLFPSEKLKGKNKDGIYDRLYFGDDIKIKKEEEIIDKNIPMDPVNFDWNEFAKKEAKKMKFYSEIDRIFSSKIMNIFFFFGFFIAIIAVVFAPYFYNIAVLLLYILLILLRELGFGLKKGGYITEKETGFPLSFAVIRVFLPEMDKETVRKVASNTGKYFCLVSPGSYYVKIEKKNQDGSYTCVYTSPLIKSKKGIIRENFKV